MNVIALPIMAILIGFFAFMTKAVHEQAEKEATAEVSIEDYRDLAVISSSCPALRTEIRTVMKDRRMNREEADGLAARMEVLIEERRTNEAKATILRNTGSDPIALPLACAEWDQSKGKPLSHRT